MIRLLPVAEMLPEPAVKAPPLGKLDAACVPGGKIISAQRTQVAMWRGSSFDIAGKAGSISKGLSAYVALLFS
jgi:hypothetical protein